MERLNMRKWMTANTVEVLGVFVFLLGNGFYFFFAKRSIDNFSFYWDVSTFTMLAGGVFILLGLIGLYCRIFSLLDSSCGDVKGRRSVGVMLVLLIIPFVIPVIFHYPYIPINENIIVKEFGCGCPNIDGSAKYFDANVYNLIVWLVVLFVSGIFWFNGICRINNYWVRFWVTIVGTAILPLLPARFYILWVWM